MKTAKCKNLFCIILVIFLLTSFLSIPQNTKAQPDNYPKLANYFLKWDISDTDINELARWDIVILSPQALERNPQVITKLRQKNPQIKIFVYVLLQEINIDPEIVNASPFYQQIYNKVQENNWWLRDSSGQNISSWPKTWLINPAPSAPKTNGQNWADYLPGLVYNNFLKTNDWDGVFFDNAWDNLNWLNKTIDINGNGRADSQNYVDQQWQAGINQILNTIQKLAPHKLIIVNTKNNFYNNNTNGRLHETFPLPDGGVWAGGIKNYLNADFGRQPQYFIINTSTSVFGKKDDYRTFRFGLTSTLLGDGYYSFDSGDHSHSELWWYDEYNFYLGRPLSDIKNLLGPESQEIRPGVWQRDFQNALILVNSTNSEQKISFTEEFEKIKGSQDQSVNSGAIVRSVTLKPYDGIILLRRIEDIKNSPYFNGSFVRVFNKYGDSIRNGFFVYEKQFKGGNVLAKADINNNGQIEIIEADKSKVIIYDQNKNVINSFYPYGPNYNFGITLAINDFENDGFFEIVTGTMRGHGPIVKVFNHQGKELNSGFNAYHPDYKGGVNVAFCDTNGNGKKEIVTGAGYMGGPQVRIFDINGKVLSGGFFAYNANFRGGVNVACGDIDGNGIDKIVTGAGYGGSSHVRYFNSKFEPLSPGFWAFGQESRTGVRVVLADLDNDGIAEILAASPDTFTTVINK
ncbi:MAG TPA: hypothetical protein ENN28_04510 [Candidatus Uhrbacteria bacterium]|nr:hypothetical protein [Candidatus Uhrbacteria bacterium]